MEQLHNFLKDRVNDPGHAFIGKIGLGPFWTLVQALSFVHVRQLFACTFVSFFPHERTSTIGMIYTQTQMQGLFVDFKFN
jgi:hypothetical protein